MVMRNEEKIVTKLNVIPMSKATKKRISKVEEEIKGKILFKEKMEFAQKTLQDVKLPM
jgi:uncharacterized protein with PhoU and TrkA domain